MTFCHSFFVWILLLILPGISETNVNLILKKVEETHKCVTVIFDQLESGQAFSRNFSGPKVEVAIGDNHDDNLRQVLLATQSHCSTYVIILDDLTQLYNFTENYGSLLSRINGRYAVILTEEHHSKVSYFLLKSTGFFSKVQDIAIFTINSSKTFLSMRNPQNEAEISTKILTEDFSPIFHENRLKNLRGKTLKATSFEYPPYNYIDDNGNHQGIESSN